MSLNRLRNSGYLNHKPVMLLMPPLGALIIAHIFLCSPLNPPEGDFNIQFSIKIIGLNQRCFAPSGGAGALRDDL